jgi:hypothetical protein
LTHFHGRGGDDDAAVGAGVDAKLVPCPATPPARKIPNFVMKLRRENNDDFSFVLSIMISFSEVFIQKTTHHDPNVNVVKQFNL